MVNSITTPTHVPIHQPANRQRQPVERPQISPATKPQPVATDTVTISPAASNSPQR